MKRLYLKVFMGLRYKYTFVFFISLILLSNQSKADPISDWNATAISITLRVPNPARNVIIDLAYMHISMYDAVNTFDGRYTSFAVNPYVAPSGSEEAAAAAAARRILLTFYPSDSIYIDSVYNARISTIPSNYGKTKSIQVGDYVAREFLRMRNNDGREADVPYIWQNEGLGVYQPTPPGAPRYLPVGTWTAQLRPFSISSPSQFQAPAPPAYTSEIYTADFNEVKKYGSLDSSFTTPEQREIARFHTENPAVQLSRNIRLFAESRGLSIADNARLFAQLYVSIADASIVGFNSKYFYNCWRPVTAIRMADMDGNPATIQDTVWKPLVGTPRHPEYPAAHGCVLGAFAATIEKFFGTSDIPVTLTSTVTGTDHHFSNTNEIITEAINARVYGGMHFRSSVEQGVEIGRKAAEWVAGHNFKLQQYPWQGKWVVQNSGLPSSINPTLVFAAVDENVCWGIQEDVVNPKCVLTTDGGTNWKTLEVQGAIGLRGLCIAAINAETAWATFEDPTGGTGGGIYKTTNGGVDWNKQTTAFQGTGVHPRRIHFFDANNGLCTGDPRGGYWEIYTTTNGGGNWTRVPSANVPAPGINDWSPSDAQAGRYYWFNTVSGSVYRTTDMGLSWNVSSNIFSSGTVGVKTAFKDSLNGIASTYFGRRINQAARTLNGGASWAALPVPPQSVSIYYLTYVPGPSGFYIATSHNNIGNPEPTKPGSMFTWDDGATWSQIDSLPHGPASFTKSGIGWSAGTGDIIYKWVYNVTSVNNTKEVAQDFQLEQNYPNPFNPSTTFGFSIPSAEFVTLTIYDILGREVALLVNENKNAGTYKVQFNAINLSTGVYMYTLKAGKYVQTKKLILMK